MCVLQKLLLVRNLQCIKKVLLIPPFQVIEKKYFKVFLKYPLQVMEKVLLMIRLQGIEIVIVDTLFAMYRNV